MCSNVSLTVYWYSWQQGVVLVDVEIAQVMHVCRYLTSTEDILLCDTDVEVIDLSPPAPGLLPSPG